MIRTTWNLSQKTAPVLRAWLPTNILRDAIYTRRGFKWGIPAMLLAVPYLYGAAICRELIGAGGPGWLHLLVILCIWNTFKMLWIGPVSLAKLAHRKRECRSGLNPPVSSSDRNR
ncbi:sulfate permease [Brevibacterium sp. XM4083]|nr:sulfate permease [Brevibacterium sp. XM4083]MCM1014348.1 sulfate permease [Brevibacterium sp. XM4083]